MRLLVQVATGPENPTRAALGLLTARTAAEEGHDVRVFLAGDGVQLARPETYLRCARARTDRCDPRVRSRREGCRLRSEGHVRHGGGR